MNNWPLVTLGEAIELAYGKSLPKSSRAEGKTPVYGSNGVTGWHDTAPVHEPTVIVGRKGSVGAVQFVEEPCYPIDTTYYVCVRAGFDFETKFLFYLLRKLDLSRLKTATGVPGLTREDAYRELIPVPPLSEQRRIVDILSRAEGIVRLRREAQKKAAEVIPALFLDMFGDPAKNPKGWKTAKVSDLLGIPVRNGISPSKSGIFYGNVLTLSAITKGYFNALAVKESTFQKQLNPNDEVSRKDFLVCRGNGNRDFVGRGCFPSNNMPGVAFPDTVIALRISETCCTREFFAAQWDTPYIRQQIDSIAKTTNGTYKINQIGLGRIELRTPQLFKQQVFSERAAIICSIRNLQIAATAKAKTIFNALLARIFNSSIH